MAKFRDTAPPSVTGVVAPEAPQGEGNTAAPGVHQRSLGEILRDLRNLSPEQVEKIVAFQRDKGLRFGEAAVQLGYVSTDDVLFALAQQFHYPVAPVESGRGNTELVALNQPFSVQAESFRALRSQVTMRVYADVSARAALAVISPDVGDGKTFFCANLAVTMAQLGGRTLVVDADLREPRMHQVFSIDNKTGLSGILSGRAESQVIKQVAGVPGLFVLPAGVTPPNPLELLERPAFGLLLNELTSKFDYVIVDTASASHGADASVTAVRCGTALVVARKDSTRVRALQDMVASLADSPVKLAGVVMNEH
jgi:chain length determinant protein tyrosine kinase EpsG